MSNLDLFDAFASPVRKEVVVVKGYVKSESIKEFAVFLQHFFFWKMQESMTQKPIKNGIT